MRSLLFVPADSPRKFAKAMQGEADALILDLEDSIAAAHKPAARESATDFLREWRSAPRAATILVRINALDTGLADADLDAVMRARPDGIMLPKAESGADVQQLGAKLAVREAENDLPDGSTFILPIVTETARAMFGLGSYAGASRRTRALTWGAEDLSASLGSEVNRLPDGGYAPPFALARNMMLFAAAATGVDAIDTIFGNFRDSAALRAECEAARRDGFAGKMAIHPDQVAIINETFTPAQKAIDEARAVIAAFAANPDAGVVSIDGAMYDRPHLLRAERVVRRDYHLGGIGGG